MLNFVTARCNDALTVIRQTVKKTLVNVAPRVTKRRNDKLKIQCTARNICYRIKNDTQQVNYDYNMNKI